MESRLREILDERGIKYSHVAKKIEMRKSRMTDIVAGATPSLKNACRIAKLLDLPVEYIWYELVETEGEANNKQGDPIQPTSS
jgi:putative transcriptional regulator